jgi:hypothetical protein
MTPPKPLTRLRDRIAAENKQAATKHYFPTPETPEAIKDPPLTKPKPKIIHPKVLIQRGLKQLDRILEHYEFLSQTNVAKPENVKTVCTILKSLQELSSDRYTTKEKTADRIDKANEEDLEELVKKIKPEEITPEEEQPE